MRTYVILALGAALLTACSSDTLAPSLAPDVASLRVSASPAGATLPFEKQYVRRTGAPVADVVTLEALTASKSEEITVRIINGTGSARATGGSVEVGGVTVLDSTSFPFTEKVVQVNIGLVRPVRVLSRITGTPGGQYTVRIESGAPVDEQGGTIAVAGGDVRIAVPAGAVGSDLAISAEPLAAPAAGTYDAYDFGPDGTTFEKPITVTFPVPTTPLPVGAVPGLFWRQNESDEWQPLANGRFDAATGTVSGEISHFTQIGVRVREMRVCPTGQNAVATVAEALSTVSRRGTIVLCDAQHDVTEVLVDKPVTITSADPTPARLVSSGTSGFRVNGVNRDSVIFRRLAFTVESGDTAITAVGTYDAVHVDSSSFALAATARAAVYAGATTVNGARFTMLDNVVTGGLRGVHVLGAPFVRIRDNQFTTQDSANIDLLGDGSVRPSGEVARNRIRECGTVGCVRLAEVASVRADSNDIASNRRTFIDAAGRTREISSGISAFGTDVRVTGNSIVGTNIANLADQLTYAWADAGIYVVTLSSSPSSVIVNDNHVEGGRRAFAGQWLTTHTVEPVIVGANNRAVRNYRVAQSVGAARVRLTRGNYSEYVFPLVNGAPIASRTGWSAGDMTCNYWGAAQGPGSVQSDPRPFKLSVFLPAASQPIANSAVECDPTPGPQPTLIRYCSTGGSIYDAVPSFTSMLWALANTPINGTLEVCSGTHAPGRTIINTPITIRGEAGGTMPTLNGTLNGFSTQVFFIENATGGITSIRNLRFINSRFESVRVAGANGPVVVENNVFEPATDPAPSNQVGFFAGVAVFSTGGSVTVRNNDFTGGDVGVNTFTQFNVIVENNRFANHGNAAVHLGGGEQTFATVRNNVVNGCGFFRCFIANNTKQVFYTNNTLNIPFRSPRTTHGIDMSADSMVVIGNTITGSGGTQTSDSNTWPMLIGIKIYGGRRAVINGNTISQASSAMRFDAATVTGSNNVVSQVLTALDARNGTTTMTRNDFTSYAQPVFVFAAPAGAPFACNYWGNASGPVNPGVLQVANFSPFSAVPIANTSIACP